MNVLTQIDWVRTALIAVPIILVLVFNRLLLRLMGIVVVPDDSIGMVTKKFSLIGRTLPPGRIIALLGEAGYQADTLAPGLHFRLYPWQYMVEIQKFTVVPQGKIGVVKAIDGKPLPAGRVVADPVDCDSFQDARAFLTGQGQRGPQAGIITPGVYRINTKLFEVGLTDALIIADDQLGVVHANDGKPMPQGRVLAEHVECSLYTNVAQFLVNGQRGPQPAVMTPGVYFLNPYLFSVDEVHATDVPPGKIGIVTTQEGEPLPAADIAGKPIAGHESFQNVAKFLAAGGSKGLQEQVLLPGRYFINPLFAKVDLDDMTDVPVANVGVVTSFVGAITQDVSGDAFKHGNLVKKGSRGVWIEPLDPGRYPVNRRTQKVTIVPTANVVLNWATAKSEAHQLDKNLSTITVRSSDGFKFNLDVAQIIHVSRNDAPKLVAQFGDMGALVTQVMEPSIGNYFRNTAQAYDVIDFLRHRQERQTEAREAIAQALAAYSIVGVDTLIGDITPPEPLMKTLTDRKIADQEKMTFGSQRDAQVVRQEFEQASATADTQRSVVAAERTVAIKEFEAAASVKTAEGTAKIAVIAADAEAAAKVTQAKADAEVLRMVGEATGAQKLAVGNAEAEVIKKKAAAMDAGNYAMVQVAEALAGAGQRLVPEIVVSSGDAKDGQGSGIVNALLGVMLRDQVKKT